MSKGIVAGPLPDFGILVGRYAGNREPAWLKSDKLQIMYSCGVVFEPEERAHAHKESVECHIILGGYAMFEIDGDEQSFQRDEFISISPGVFHRTLLLSDACRLLTIRAPSVDDKVYQ